MEPQSSAALPAAPWYSRLRIGPMPLLLYLVLSAVVATAAVVGRLPLDMVGGFAVIMLLGWLLGDIGLKTPILKDIGGPAILSLLVPSILIFHGLLNRTAQDAITAVMKTDNFLYLYIACLVCGSVLGMNRKVLVQGFLRLAGPLIAGEIVTIAVGIGVGLLVGFAPHRTYFYIIVPIIGGGIGEGLLPYSLAMAEILARPQAELIPQLIPAAMLGNLIAVVASGGMKRFGEKFPRFSGQGLLVRTGEDRELLAAAKQEKPVEFPLMGAGLLLACSFFVFGNTLSRYVGIPGPIIMIFTAAIVKYSRLMPARMEQGAYHMYRFIATNLTWPLLVGLGALYVPCKEVVAALTPGYLAVCLSAVAAMWTTGFVVGRILRMYPVESAIVTGCHTGLGGTGDVAILSAANRIELMPFAQAATRLGGALMIVVATVLLKLWH